MSRGTAPGGRSDVPFLVALGVMGGFYVLLIVSMLLADVLSTTPGTRSTCMLPSSAIFGLPPDGLFWACSQAETNSDKARTGTRSDHMPATRVEGGTCFIIALCVC